MLAWANEIIENTLQSDFLAWPLYSISNKNNKMHIDACLCIPLIHGYYNTWLDGMLSKIRTWIIITNPWTHLYEWSNPCVIFSVSPCSSASMEDMWAVRNTSLVYINE